MFFKLVLKAWKTICRSRGRDSVPVPRGPSVSVNQGPAPQHLRREQLIGDEREVIDTSPYAFALPLALSPMIGASFFEFSGEVFETGSTVAHQDRSRIFSPPVSFTSMYSSTWGSLELGASALLSAEESVKKPVAESGASFFKFSGEVSERRSTVAHQDRSRIFSPPVSFTNMYASTWGSLELGASALLSAEESVKKPVAESDPRASLGIGRPPTRTQNDNRTASLVVQGRRRESKKFDAAASNRWRQLSFEDHSLGSIAEEEEIPIILKNIRFYPFVSPAPAPHPSLAEHHGTTCPLPTPVTFRDDYLSKKDRTTG